ncbi:hypothetical protein V4890_12915 [Ralstonia solanacearum species complex bacterium KE056]|uniref:hypothetical protein n=1 Tax=Ralstonia solanacearum species complex bacterium KE056 TaxID=3119585 RepID=UPI002FC33B85
MSSNKKLSAVITIGGAISSSLKSAFGTTKVGLDSIGKSVTDLEKRQRLLGRSIQEFGRAGKDITGMRNRYAELTQQLDRTRRAQERLATAQARAAKIGAFARGAGVAVGAAVAGGAVVGRPLIRSAIARENEVNLIKNSGASKEEVDEMLHAAEKTKQFGVSVTEAVHVVGQLRAAFGDAHHAVEALPLALKAKSGLQLYDRLHGSDLANGDSAYTLAKIAEERGGAKTPEAMAAKFNWAFKGLTGSGGHVGVDQWLNAIRSGKGAVRAMDDASFFGDTFLMQSMGADRYGTASSSLLNGWVAGRATHSALQRMLDIGLMDRSKVKFDKTGKVKSAVGALKDGQLFIKDPQAWVDKYLIPAMKARGVDITDAAQVNEFNAQIASNANANAILTNRVLDSQNIAKDRRNVMKANGVNESDQQNKDSTQGKIENARRRLDDVEERMGNVILPVLATALEKVATGLEAVNKFADESPTAFKAVTFGLVGLTGAVAGLATAGLAKTAVTGLVGALGSGAGGLGSAVAALANPIGIAVVTLGTLAAAAYAFRPISQAEVDAAKDQGGAKLTPAAKARVDAGELGKLPLPQVSSMGAGRGGAAPVTNNNSYAINITAAPGMDERRIGEIAVRELERREGIQIRSRMYDGPSR